MVWNKRNFILSVCLLGLAIKGNTQSAKGRPNIILIGGRLVRQGKNVMAGPADTYISYMRPWANVSNTPFRMYKHWVYEGGISTPMIVHWPDGIKSHGGIRNQTGHEIDIMPTLVTLAKAHYPVSFKGNTITPMQGVSLTPSFSNKPLPARTLYWEHEMNKAVRSGDWKLVCRSEMHNLAGQYPDRVRKMSESWMKWANGARVFPAPWTEEKNQER